MSSVDKTTVDQYQDAVKKNFVNATHKEKETEKRCSSCQLTQTISNFYSRNDRKDSHHRVCKNCISLNSAQKRYEALDDDKKIEFLNRKAAKELLQNGLKKCHRCQEQKTLEHFSTRTDTLKYAICRACRPVAQKEYLEANPVINLNKRAKDRLYRQVVLDYIQPLKEAGCADCKKYFPHAMEFDHTCNPQDKLCNISDIHFQPGASTSLLKILQMELSKGDFVCSNCHSKRTASRYPLNYRLLFMQYPQSDKITAKMRFAYQHLNNFSCIDCQ
jgi:hypothetical protein